MKKHFGKALAMAVMMSVLAGGSAYAAASVTTYGNLNSTTYTTSSKAQIKLEDEDYKNVILGTEGIFFNNENAAKITGLADGGISSTSTNAVNGKEVYTALQGYVEKGTVDSTSTNSQAIGSGSKVKEGASQSVAVGDEAYVTAGAERSTAVGYNSRSWASYSVAIGYGAGANYFSSVGMIGNNVAVGTSSLAYNNSTALGAHAYAYVNSIAIGRLSEAGKGDSVTDSIAIGKEAKAKVANSIALGNGAEVTVDNAIAIGNNSKATEADTISVGNDTLKRKITNVAAGDITSATSTDAVTGGQIYTMTNVTKGNYIAAGTDVAGNLTALDTQVKINADDIASLKTSKADKTYVDTELAKKANVADVYTKSETESAISTAVNTATAGKADRSYVDTELGKKADKATSLAGYGITDGATKTELADEAKAREDGDADTLKKANDYTDQEIAKISGGASTEALEKLDNKINQTNDRVDRVGATAAALAAINYQPMAKGQSQVAVGMGGYKGKKATALGLAYQISDRVSGSVAGAANGSEHMFNVGFNYLFGQHSDKDVAQCTAVPGSVSLKEAELQAQVDSLKSDNAAMRADNQAMQARMAQLEAMVKALAAK